MQQSGCLSCPAPRHGVVENLRRLREARDAMRKAHEARSAGDYAGAIKCLQEARDTVAAG